MVGLLSLEQGRDFSAICLRLSELGYRYGAVVIDAKMFLPQSRPRVFLVAVHRSIAFSDELYSDSAREAWHPPVLVRAHSFLPMRAREDWVWWDLGVEAVLRANALENLIMLHVVS